VCVCVCVCVPEEVYLDVSRSRAVICTCELLISSNSAECLSRSDAFSSCIYNVSHIPAKKPYITTKRQYASATSPSSNVDKFRGKKHIFPKMSPICSNNSTFCPHKRAICPPKSPVCLQKRPVWPQSALQIQGGEE